MRWPAAVVFVVLTIALLALEPISDMTERPLIEACVTNGGEWIGDDCRRPVSHETSETE